MTAVCPMVGLAKCFEAHPTECAHVFDSMSMGSRRLTGDLNTEMAQLEQQCAAAGVSTTIAKENKVTTMLTLEGLDYAKVMADEAAKNEIIGSVKNRFLAKMSGYSASDL